MAVGVCFNLNWFPLATHGHCWLNLEVMIGMVTIVTRNSIEF